jgi:HSP20 family protein
VTAELAGVELAELDLEIQGRRLILAGQRSAAAEQDEVYQQVEIERGAFRRVIDLGIEVRAEEASAQYEDGMLRVELPLAPAEPRARAVPIEPGDAAPAQIGEPGRRPGGKHTGGSP